MRFARIFKRRRNRKAAKKAEAEAREKLLAPEKKVQEDEQTLTIVQEDVTSKRDIDEGRVSKEEKTTTTEEETHDEGTFKNEDEATHSTISITEVKVYLESDDSEEETESTNRDSSDSDQNDESKNEGTCNACGSLGAKARCGACFTVYYCSKECQAKDWQEGRHWDKCPANKNPPVAAVAVVAAASAAADDDAAEDSSVISEVKKLDDDDVVDEDSHPLAVTLVYKTAEDKSLSTSSKGCISYEENSLEEKSIASASASVSRTPKEKDVAVEVNIINLDEKEDAPQVKSVDDSSSSIAGRVQVNVVLDEDNGGYECNEIFADDVVRDCNETVSTMGNTLDYPKRATPNRYHMTDNSAGSVFTIESRSVGAESLETITEENSRNIFFDDDNTFAGNSVAKSEATSTTEGSDSSNGSANTEIYETRSSKQIKRKDIATQVLTMVLEQVADKGACLCQESQRVIRGCRETTTRYMTYEDESTNSSHSVSRHRRKSETPTRYRAYDDESTVVSGPEPLQLGRSDTSARYKAYDDESTVGSHSVLPLQRGRSDSSARYIYDDESSFGTNAGPRQYKRSGKSARNKKYDDESTVGSYSAPRMFY